MKKINPILYSHTKLFSFAVLLSLVLLLPCGVSQARIPDSEVAIGGVTCSSTLDYVISIYGPPDRQKDNWIYYWGTSFEVVVTKSSKVSSVSTTDENGIGTPAGIYVGMPASALHSTYGKADHVDVDSSSNTVYSYGSQSNKRGWLMFRVRNGMIQAIDMVSVFS